MHCLEGDLNSPCEYELDVEIKLRVAFKLPKTKMSRHSILRISALPETQLTK